MSLPVTLAIPFAAAALARVLGPVHRRLAPALGLAAALFSLVLTSRFPSAAPPAYSWSGIEILRVEPLGAFLLPAVAFFAVLMAIYTLKPGSRAGGEGSSSLMLLSWGAAQGVLLSGHLLPLLVFWGLIGICLYLLTDRGGSAASPAAKKTLIIVGGSDALLLLGAALLVHLNRSWSFDAGPLPVRGWSATAAFFAVAAAAGAKIGAVPFHSWVPDVSENAPLPAAAFLPACLDKIVGVFLLARVATGLFSFSPDLRLLLLLLGAASLVGAVLAALIQENGRRLLGFHAVSQAGYMILGIASGTALGIAGGLFHMLNNAVYKQGLFLGLGAVEKDRGTTDLDRLGGLSRSLPSTFGSFSVFSLAISGIPPFNGFISKWMIYMGLLEMRWAGFGLASRFWPVWLLAAMAGSAFTLASFMKLVHAVFLGRGEGGDKSSGSEAFRLGWSTLIPPAVLALICLAAGVLAYPLVIDGWLRAAVAGLAPAAEWPGFFSPLYAAVLLLAALTAGVLIYWWGAAAGYRRDTPFIGGEELLPEESRVTGTGFYLELKRSAPLSWFYRAAAAGRFDFYRLVTEATLKVSRSLQLLHRGVLSTYVGWILAGFAALAVFLALMGL